ncbi:hypothetical protein ABZX95_10820 [Streptomyces sp. NPDC004232]|uniref:hypothetical protein n=1 Tax=Streptomyces sp. NPDC004232 TaxID=3154454 RepID=UPI001D39EAD3|nr:hypothetical protein [Streptomyces sp. tea 10]
MPSRLPAFLVTTCLPAMLPGAGQVVMIRQVLSSGLRTARGTIAGLLALIEEQARSPRPPMPCGSRRPP